MDLVEFGLMMRIFLNAGTIVSFDFVMLEVGDGVKTTLEEKILQEGILSIVHAPVFALLDINDQEASETESFGSSRTSPLLLLADFLNGCSQQYLQATKGSSVQAVSSADRDPARDGGRCGRSDGHPLSANARHFEPPKSKAQHLFPPSCTRLGTFSTTKILNPPTITCHWSHGLFSSCISDGPVCLVISTFRHATSDSWDCCNCVFSCP